MKFKFENFRIIKNGEIDLKGITVLIGNNNTGKTTLSKAIHTTIKVNNLSKKFILSQAVKTLVKDLYSDVENILKPSNNKYYYNSLNRRPDDKLDDRDSYRLIQNLVNEIEKNIKLFFNESKNIRFIDNRVVINKENLISILGLIIDENKSNDKVELRWGSQKQESNSKNAKFYNSLETNRAKIIQSIIMKLDLVNNKRHYLNIYNRAFNQTFNGEIHNYEQRKPKIFIDDNCIFDLENGFVRGRNIDIKKSVYIKSSSLWNNENDYLKQSSKKNDIIDLDTNLDELINNKNTDVDIFDYDRTKRKREYLLQLINESIGGEIIKSGKNDIYFEYNQVRNKKFHINDMGAGIKKFITLSMLLQNNHLDRETLLIIDEPELHLHKEWQIKFAKFLVYLKKILGVKILINSHSLLFIKTINTCGEKEQLKDQINIYTTKIEENPLEVYLEKAILNYNDLNLNESEEDEITEKLKNLDKYFRDFI